jgi:hypothetical protein
MSSGNVSAIGYTAQLEAGMLKVVAIGGFVFLVWAFSGGHGHGGTLFPAILWAIVFGAIIGHRRRAAMTPEERGLEDVAYELRQLRRSGRWRR